MSIVATLRRRILTPDVSETSVAVRGFHVKSPEARERLETVGRSFLTGFAHAAEAKVPADAEDGLETVTAAYRGFAYEGAAMALAVRDALSIGRGRHVERFLGGRAEAHVYMAYVGVGWAMARIPAFRRHTLYAADPVLRWLILDGYGFHQAYFHTARYVHGHHRPDHLDWPGGGPSWYVHRVVDQGIGRAMWFVAGTDASLLHTLVQRFPEHRRADLYAGAGLAACYAGGADEAELRGLRDAAGPYAPELAQGASFAAGARVRAGLVVAHNEVATRVLCGLTPAEATAVNDEALRDLPTGGDLPAYEVWRQRIRARYADPATDSPAPATQPVPRERTR
ncbi:DUF1702 family protein [Catenuloplanes sp. NPDC051500]|uniref:DUF1702 family protein n=1 Tax=Catenuloplanes sp. NPDC051500 TaxID=3363959 RepID=UPI00379DC98C